MEKVKSKLYDLDKDLDNYLIYDKETMIKEEIFIDGKNQGIELERQNIIRMLLASGMSKEEIQQRTGLSFDIPDSKDIENNNRKD